MQAEDYALVLDFIPNGMPGDYRKTPLTQLIGINHFTLLEAMPKENVDFKTLEKVYIGKDARDKINMIKRRISFKELTSNSNLDIEKAIEKIVMERKDFFLKFFNESKPMSVKRHQLELLPGIGHKHAQEIIKTREEKPFESFEDIANRIKQLPDPVKLIVKRVQEELEELDKFYIFVRRPAEPFEDRQQFRRY